MNLSRTVAQFMERQVETLGYDSMLSDAFKVMVQQNQRSVVIVDDRGIMGLINASDMARFIIQERDLKGSSIRDFMTFCSLSGPAPCIQISDDDTLLNALKVMVMWGADVVVVVDRNNNLVGTIDLLQALKGIKD